MPENQEPGVEPKEELAPLGRRPSSSRTHRRVWILAVGSLTIAGLLFFQRSGRGQAGGQQGSQPGEQAPQSSSKSKSAERPPTVAVATAAALKGDMGVYVNALGYVTPINTITVRTRVDGELLSVNYREGQMVRKGAVLAQIDPRPFQAQLTMAEGQYERDKAQLDEAYIDLDRYKAAYARNAIPKQQLDVQQATAHQDEGTVKVDSGQVDNAKVNLDYCTIKSPITGRVGLRLVDPGNIAHAADTNGLLVITQLQPITVVFSVAEDYLSQVQQALRKGQRLQVDALDRTQQKKLGSGYVEALDNQIDATTGTARLRAVFQNPDGILFPNQFVNVKLLLGTQRDATLIPSGAIQLGPNGSYVFVINPDMTAAMRQVTPGATDGETTAVQGVQPGEIVATDGFDKLQNGVKVAVRSGPGSGKSGEGAPGSRSNGYGDATP